MQTFLASIIRQYDFNLLYAKALVSDMSEEQMTMVPSKGLDNHPAFTIGHLVSGSAMMAEDLGGTALLPDGWADLFQRKGPNDQKRPDEDKTKYPAKSALIKALEYQHEQVKQLLLTTDITTLETPVKWRFGIICPPCRILFYSCASATNRCTWASLPHGAERLDYRLLLAPYKVYRTLKL